MGSGFSFTWSPCNISPCRAVGGRGAGGGEPDAAKLLFTSWGKKKKKTQPNKLVFCSLRNFRFIAHNYVNSHKSVEKFKLQEHVIPVRKSAPHCGKASLFQLLLFQRTCPKFLIRFLGCEKWPLNRAGQNGKVWSALRGSVLCKMGSPLTSTSWPPIFKKVSLP